MPQTRVRFAAEPLYRRVEDGRAVLVEFSGPIEQSLDIGNFSPVPRRQDTRSSTLLMVASGPLSVAMTSYCAITPTPIGLSWCGSQTAIFIYFVGA